MKSAKYLLICLACMVAMTGFAVAEDDAASDAEALAKTIQNPLAAMVTLPFQMNYNKGIGPFDRTMTNLNMQPVVPFTGKKWNVIARTIIPINSMPTGETGSTFGLGDINMAVFFSPAKGGKVTWGIGPTFGIPSATNDEILGSGKWGLGPTAVIFYGTGKWTMGAVASNTWSVAGADDREDYNILAAQYFVNYNFGKGWALGTAPNISANWKADSGEKWTIPWGLQVSKLTHFGARPVSLLAGYYTNSDHPTGASDRQVRFQINFLFPAGR